jgi:hypothetical protein
VGFPVWELRKLASRAGRGRNAPSYKEKDDVPEVTPFLLVVMTDGRANCIGQTVPSFLSMASYPPAKMLIFDDSGDTHYFQWLTRSFPGARIFGSAERRGYAGAYGKAWSVLSQEDLPEWCFFLEDDFLFNREIDIQGMIDVLKERPYLQQMALRRQPWNAREKMAGGVVEQRRREFTEVTDGTRTWLESRLFWTCNPSIYRRSLTSMGWPQVKRSEQMLTRKLLQKRANKFGYWGGFDSGEACFHIGVKRNGNGY